MRCGSWGKEPFDLRLTLLRMIRCLPYILPVILAGTLLFGGGYYVKNILLQREKTFQAQATFLVDYEDENWAVDLKYINEYSWNLWMQSDVFQDFVRGYLPEALKGRELGDMLKATVPSDLRVVQIDAGSGDPGEAQELLAAVSSAMINDFPGVMEDIADIRLTDTESPKEVKPDVRPVRAFVLAALLSALFALLGFLVRELTAERIWLPGSLTNLYGLRSVGVYGTDAFQENLKYFLQGKKRIAVISAKDRKDAEEFVAEVRKNAALGGVSFFSGDCPVTAPESAGLLREAEGVLLMVPAGSDAKELEFLLDFLEQQNIPVTGAFLWRADDWLIRNYYRLARW